MRSPSNTASPPLVPIQSRPRRSSSSVRTFGLGSPSGLEKVLKRSPSQRQSPQVVATQR